MTGLLEYIEGFLQNLPLHLEQILPRLQLSFFLILFIFFLRFLLLRLLFFRVKTLQPKRTWRLSSFYISLFLIFLLLASIWLPFLSGFFTLLSIVGTGIIIVSKEVILNMLGWAYLLARRQFEPGNRITIGEHIGDVLEIRLLDFSMIEVHSVKDGGQSTGKVLHVPNAFVFTLPVSNASKEFSFNWNEIRIPLTIESDWNKAVRLIEEIAVTVLKNISKEDQRIRRSEKKYAIFYNQLAPSVYLDFHSGAVLVYLRYLVEPRNTRVTTDKIWREILSRFDEHRTIHLFPDNIEID